MIGSRNSLCCHNVTKWWMKLIRPFYRCQKLTLDEQLKAGVRFFDFTLKLSNDTGKIMCFCQGPLEFTDSVRKTFYKLNKYKGITVRIKFIVEDELDISLFIEYATLLKNKYKRVYFIGGESNLNNFTYNYDKPEILEVNKKASKIQSSIKYILANFVDKNYD